MTDAVGRAYVRGLLAQALRAAAMHEDGALRASAEQRVEALTQLLANLASGALAVGARQPYAELPTWVTLEVMRGGFASGRALAGGALRPHEIALARQLGVWPTRDRSAINGHFLTADGLAELTERLHTRSYRVDVPEEGALLAAASLVERGDLAGAAQVLEAIEPFFDRLRFIPSPAERGAAPCPQVGNDVPVVVRSAADLADTLANEEPSPQVEAMREHYEVWAPLTDLAVTLVLDTVDGETPRFEGEGAARRVVGGVPFAVWPRDFEARRVAIVAEVATARATHRFCTRVHRPNEVLGLLVTTLDRWPRLDPVSRAQAAMRVRHRVAGFVSSHGIPGSESHRALRASQVAGPSHGAIAQVVAARLRGVAGLDEGLTPEQVETLTSPLTEAEAQRLAPAGSRPPTTLVRRLQAIEAAPLRVHTARGFVRSSEALAKLVPQLTAPALAMRFDDAATRALYAATYRAFRRRRSLLLTQLRHQVRFEELPWIAALERTADRPPALAESLRALVDNVFSTFPATVTPNKLVSELDTVARQAWPTTPGEPARLPLVEELASDIFMGTFSSKFARAANLAATFLERHAGPNGSLYARYYGLDLERMKTLAASVDARWGAMTSPAFDSYCVELAALPAGGNPVARNGAVIEQGSILTTHNMAVLFGELDLPTLRSAAQLAEGAWSRLLEDVEHRVLRERNPWSSRLRASKTVAFAWRQMLFFASLIDERVLAAFVAQADTKLAARSDAARRRLEPVMAGLHVVARGGTLPREASHRPIDGARRLLGWCVERPMLLAD